MKNKTFALITGVLVIVVVALYFSIYYVQPPTSGKYDSLTKCLTAQGAIMYGQVGCHACEYQMQLLGDSFKYINVIECEEGSPLCTNQHITVTPTWIINNTMLVGYQTPEQLANASGCSINVTGL